MDQTVHSAVVCDPPSGPPPTLQRILSYVGRGSVTERAAAIVGIDAVGVPVWNTPDGHRWTQAEIDAGTVVQPSIYTPVTVTVQRALGGPVATGQRISAYLEGGRTVQGDELRPCPNAAIAPQAGLTAVVILGTEEDAPATAASPLHKPVLTEFDVIRDGAAQTVNGPQPTP